MSADSRARALRRRYVSEGWDVHLRRGSLHYGIHCPACERLVTTIGGTPRTESTHYTDTYLRRHRAECPDAPAPARRR